MLRTNRLKAYLSPEWREIYARFMDDAMCDEDYTQYEAIGFSYSFTPTFKNLFSNLDTLLDKRKALAMYEWYKKGLQSDYEILHYFPEYARCIDDTHKLFNSNYGYYAYTKGGLNLCIDRLLADPSTRQACFCINNNEAMGTDSIDKLCTNTIQFFVRADTLEMVVQMRSSNFLTLLPYDAMMFASFYHRVYSMLKPFMVNLAVGKVRMHAGSLHMYVKDLREKIDNCENELGAFVPFHDEKYHEKLADIYKIILIQ